MERYEIRERYKVDSYDEIKKLVDAGEIVECNVEVHDWCQADFLVEKDEDGDYVVRGERDTLIEEHDINDFCVTRFISADGKK